MGRRIWVLVLLLSLVTAVNAEGAISFGSGVEGIVFAADGATPSSVRDTTSAFRFAASFQSSRFREMWRQMEARKAKKYFGR